VLKVFRKYSSIILSYRITKLEQIGHLLRLRAEIELLDHSRLFVRETVLGAAKRKYSYHWQDKHGKLLIRWDNAPDWDTETFPHHKHISEERNVELSHERTLEQVLAYLSNSLKQ
jgi:hypothetical protein